MKVARQGEFSNRILTDSSLFATIGQFFIPSAHVSIAPGHFFSFCLLVGHASLACVRLSPSNTRFPVPAGLQDAVDFWKQVFTRYGFGEVILFDPLDPGKIYSVVRAAETEQGRALG